jgi:hypothetical protein
LKNPPTIRKQKRRTLIHTTGERCCINCIFEKDVKGNYTRNALLYQDILEYFNIHEEKIEQKVESVHQNNKNIKRKIDIVRLRIEPEYFTARNLTRWLLKKNLEFTEYYSGLNRYMTNNTKILNRLGTVKDYINDLEELKMLIQTGFEEASKNRVPTATYQITSFGLIILLLMKCASKDTSKEAKIKLCKTILQLFQQYLLHYNSHICDFMVQLYSKAIQIGLSESMIDLLLMVIHSNKHTIRKLVDAFNMALHTHLMNGRTRDYFVNIWMETLKEFPEDVQRIIIYHEKAEIESRIHLAQPPKDWEETWISNIQNYSQLTLYGKCNQCSKKYPVMIDYYEYRKEVLYSGTIKRDCLKCNAENSLVVASEIKE